jgi:hypothetical protein
VLRPVDGRVVRDLAQSRISTGNFSTACVSGFKESSASAALLTLAGNNSVVDDVCFQRAGSPATASGADIVITSTQGTIIRNSDFNNPCIAIDDQNGSGNHIEGNHIKVPT